MTTNISLRTIISVGLVSAMLIGPLVASAALLPRSLELGMSGNDVSDLQTFLAKDNTIYPQGLVTGYFGSLTKSAVSNFQARNSIETVGRVGPVTRAAINAQMGGGTATNWDPVPTLYNVYANTTSNSAVINWTTNEATKGVVYYNNAPLTENEHINSVDVSGAVAMTDATFRTTQSVSITGLQPNTLYYYLVYVTDSAGGVTVTIPFTFHTAN